MTAIRTSLFVPAAVILASACGSAQNKATGTTEKPASTEKRTSVEVLAKSVSPDAVIADYCTGETPDGLCKPPYHERTPTSASA